MLVASAHSCDLATQGASKLDMDPPKPEPSPGLPRQVVYVPSCVTRMMGPSRSDSETASVHEKLLSLFAKAGYEVIYPEVSPVHGISCCTTISLRSSYDHTGLDIDAVVCLLCAIAISAGCCTTLLHDN